MPNVGAADKRAVDRVLVMVQPLPKVKLAPTVNVPLVKFKAVATVVAELSVTPPVPLIVSVLTLPVNKPLGKVIALVFVKDNTALALLASIVPEVLVREVNVLGIVNVLVPIVNVPDVSVKAVTIV